LKEVKKMKCRKQFFIIVLALVAASVFAGVAAAQVPVCFTICPSNAQPGDLVTMTAFDENGEMIDLSTVEIFESNIWGAALPDAEDDRFHSLVYVQGDELFINIEIIDGAVVFELTEEMLSDNVTMWDYFGIPGEDDAAFRIVGEDGPFETVAEAIAAGGTCSVSFGYTCGGESPRPSFPVDGATFVDPDVVLEWTPGAKAVTEDVYFDGALALEGTTETSYDPSPDGMLDWGTTYEWEVRDVNAAEPNSPFVGGPWTFTTEPYLYDIADQGRLAEDDGITASSTIEESDPALTVEGLDGDIHGNNLGDMWLSDVEPGGTASIQYVFDTAYQLEELEIWNYNDSLEIVFGNGFADTVIEVSTDDPEEEEKTWIELTTVNLAQAPGEPTGPTDTLDLQGTIATALRLTARSNHSGDNDQFGLSAVRIHYVPLRAMDPVPEPGETVEVDDLMLEWRAGRKAATHLLYLSEDEDAVIEGTVTPISRDEPGFAPEDLMLGQEYFWRVDEVNEAETPASLDGNVWSFMTQEYIVVDDFEAYNDLNPDDPESKRIFLTWIGGDDNPDNGSQVGHDTFPFAEHTIVYDGDQSMPFFYNNIGSVVMSEATRTFDEAQDWTRSESEAQALTFYVHGIEDNAGGQMYVKVNGDKQAVTVDLTEEDWQEVNVELASFTGANLQAVTSLTIGIENSGNGVVFIDNIRLYPSRCLAGSEGTLRDDGDLNGDCIVDALDLAIVLDNWLGSGTPLVEYTFDSGLADSSGNGRDGVPVDGPVVAGGILTLDGTNRVEIPFAENPFDGTQSWTIELEFQTTVGGAMLAMGPLDEEAEILGRPLVYLGNEDTPGDWRWGFCGLWIEEGMSGADGGGPWGDPNELEGALYPQNGEWRSLVATYSSDPEAGVASGASWVDGIYVFNDLADMNWLYGDGIVPFDNSTDEVWIGMRPNGRVMEWLPVPTGGPYSGNLDNIRIYPYAVDSPDAERFHPGDVNKDNVVDQADLDIVEGNEGKNVLWP
jgi:hypothetical protein